MEQTTFTYEAREQMLVIHLPKELDHHNCRNLKRDTDLLLAENYINRIVFDFTHTSFMDSSGIGVLLNRYKQMANQGGVLSHHSKRGAPQPGNRGLLRGRTPGQADTGDGRGKPPYQRI